MAPKQKPLTVGKGTSAPHLKGDGKAPRAVSAKPSEASKVRAAQKTTSSGITKRPNGRTQPEGRAARSSVSTAKVTTGSNGKPSNVGSAKVTQGGPSESRIRSMEAGPGKVKAGMGGGTTLSSKPGANAAGAQAAKDAARMANRAAKGYGQPGKVEAGIRRAAGMGMTAARIARGVTPAGVAYETLKPRPTAAGTLPPGKFANARDLAFAKAKGIKGSPVLGGKKSVAASFDSAFAAARKAGKSGFTFKGKKYTTKMK